MNRKMSFAPGEFYHVYNRGNDKRVIFKDHADYKRFLRLMFFCNGTERIEMKRLVKRIDRGETLDDLREVRGEPVVDIGAYCLMPNHFHILVCEKEDGGIANFVKKLCTGYSMYFNIKNERTGKLFEGAFKAERADTDEYLKYLFSYIHLNPAKILEPKWKENGIRDIPNVRSFVEKYEFSSYRNYLGDKNNIEILNSEAFPGYFKDSNVKDEIEEWLTFDHTKVLPSS